MNIVDQYLGELALSLKPRVDVAGRPAAVSAAAGKTPPWVDPPESAIPFDPTSAITTPAPGAGDTVVLSFVVPRGHDGVITGLMHLYSGGGLQQGSGGIIWRLLIDGRAVRNYDAMTVEFGSTAQPRRIAGLRIYENQTVEYVVQLPAGTAFVYSQETQIICSVSGWLYPRGLGQ